MELPNKKGTEEDIISNILKWYIKSGFHVIKNEFVGLLNDSLKTGQCPDQWKISTIKPISKVGKSRTASKYRRVVR